jgi:hypothetical protein
MLSLELGYYRCSLELENILIFPITTVLGMEWSVSEDNANEMEGLRRRDFSVSETVASTEEGAQYLRRRLSARHLRRHR